MFPFPHSFRLPKPPIDHRHIRGCDVPRTEERLIPECTLERCELPGSVPGGVLRIFGPEEVISPIVLPATAVRPEVMAEVLNGAFSLPIRLDVVPRRQADRGPQLFEKAFHTREVKCGP